METKCELSFGNSNSEYKLNNVNTDGLINSKYKIKINDNFNSVNNTNKNKINKNNSFIFYGMDKNKNKNLSKFKKISKSNFPSSFKYIYKTEIIILNLTLLPQ